MNITENVNFVTSIIALMIWASSSIAHAAFIGHGSTNNYATHHNNNNNRMMYQQQSMNIHHPSSSWSSSKHDQGNRRISTASLSLSLRDIMDDGPLIPPSTNNDVYNTPEYAQQEQQQEQQLLAQKLLNLSTQEIKRELEHVHGISTVALRGKTQLVEALVDARFKLLNHDNNGYGAVMMDNNDGVSSSSGGVGTSSRSSASSSSTSSNSNSNNGYNINMNHGPDIKTMGVAEIKRELQLYGILTTDEFVEKRDLEVALLRERQRRIPRENNGASSSQVPPDMIPQSQTSSPPENNDYIYDEKQSPNDRAKLRELQIAFEFERVQSSLPDPSDVQYELETKFSISTKYFLGIKEMAYALAVSRVDNRLERQRLGLSSDGCVVSEDGKPVEGGLECASEDTLPTPEELVDMEYENLQPWDEVSLAAELENQYGIPAKHFMGKTEMAYALAVERVDRAMKEGGFIMDSDYEEEVYEEAVSMTDEDMMKMMEEEMRKEEEEEEEELRMEQEEQQQRSNYRESIRDTASVRSSFPSPSSSFSNPPKSTSLFEKHQPNPFQKSRVEYQSTPLADMIKNDKKDRSSRRPPQPKRTPLSAEPPHSFGRSQRQQQNRRNSVPTMGTVIGGGAAASSNSDTILPNINNPPPQRESSFLNDILKGSEQQKDKRSRATAPPFRTKVQDRPLRSRSSATTPPPRPKAQDRPPRSRSKTFKTSSAHIDESFRPNESGGSGIGSGRNNVNNKGRGYNTSWNNNNNGPRVSNPAAAYGNVSANNNNNNGGGYTSSWNKPRPHSAAAATSSRRSKSSANTQRPFEPTPFTQPGTHNAQGSSSSSRAGPQRVPPQTAFSSPVTDGAQNRSSRGSQGPFTPFTSPEKRSTNGVPPPSKRQMDPRGFNIKDTPDTSQAFVGSQVFVDQNTPYSPPLQVEPPPRDPNYKPPERPFEPTPFSNPHVRNHASAASSRRMNNNSVPPNANNGRQQQQQQPQNQQTTKRRTGGATPFDNLKDMFSNIKSGRGKKEEETAEPKVFNGGNVEFKSGNVEVFSSDDDDDNELPRKTSKARQQQDEIWQQAMEVEILDAEMEATADDWELDDDGEYDASSSGPYQSSDQQFSDAWMEGPESASSPSFGGSSSEATYYDNDIQDDNVSSMNEDAAIQKARHLLTTNQKIREIVAKAQSNPKVREAVSECMGNPMAFGWYLNDPDVGPILNELRDCILV